jgi:5-dehydro-4-deoxyglucarate dehydratase
VPHAESLADRLDGLLFFPVTAFDAKGAVDLDVYREHVGRRVADGPAAVFACCGTGEYPALDLDEYRACVAAAVAEVRGRVPVVAGVGHGTALAVQFVRAAEEAGADGLLVLPPYLLRPGQAGLVRHYLTLADATDLEQVVYLRDNAVLTPESAAEIARHPRIVGLKDGVGDVDLMQRIMGAIRRDGNELLYVNGLPTAEMTALAYRGIGVEAYSSAVFCFAPRISLTFFWALRSGDDTTVRELLDGFYQPLVELRRRGAGYAVSLIKAAVRRTGCDVGEVRPPLAEPPPGHLAELAAIVERGHALVDAIEARTEEI